MSAAALLREARLAGVTLRLADGRPKVSGAPSPELLARLRAHKPELLALLRGQTCRQCDAALPHPASLGSLLVFGDGTVECMRCGDREAGRLLAAGRRAVESPAALAAPAEMMLQPGGLS